MAGERWLPRFADLPIQIAGRTRRPPNQREDLCSGLLPLVSDPPWIPWEQRWFDQHPQPGIVYRGSRPNFGPLPFQKEGYRVSCAQRVQGMPNAMIDDKLWALIEPLLPPAKPRRFRNGRKPVPDRAALAGILFVLKTGIPGTSCQQRWATDQVSVAGVAIATGSRLACGPGCTKYCVRI